MQANDRLHALDAVRAYALLLGVVLHTAAAFLQDFPIPAWRDQPSATAALIYTVIHMFRMSAFFLIAGFFARMVVERRGAKAFIKDRLKRVGIPLLALPIFVISIVIGIVLGTLTHGLEALTALAQQQATEQEAVTGFSINLSHLWFLYYLLVFYALILFVRAITIKVDPKGALAFFFDRIVAFIMKGIWGPALIALPLIVYFYQLDSWVEWVGFPAPFSLVPTLEALISYGIPFGLGWLFHRQIHLLLSLQNKWLIYLVLAVICTTITRIVIGSTPIWEGPALAGTERLIYTVAYMIGAWCWIFAFIGAAVRFLSAESPINRYLADASYWIYLMHMMAVAFFIALVKPFDWPWAIKFLIIFGGSMPILVLSYHYLVRYSWIGAILNGRRHPRPVKKNPDSESSTS